MANGTKQRILDAAGRLFLQYGYKHTTVDDIAVEAGVAKGSIYLHFDSKETIFGTVCQRLITEVLGRMEAIVAGGGPPETRLKDVIVSSGLYIWDFCHQAPHAPELWAEVTAAASKHALEAYAAARKILAGVIAEAQETGEFHLELPPEQLARLLQLAVQGFDPPFLLVHSREQVVEQLPQLVDLFTRGMKFAPSPGAGEADA